MNDFKSTIEDYSLVEVDLSGGALTWEKGKGTTYWVCERLDRAVLQSPGGTYSLFARCQSSMLQFRP